jgi:hypothetical protein
MGGFQENNEADSLYLGDELDVRLENRVRKTKLEAKTGEPESVLRLILRLFPA